ncbi:MAG TPA: LysM domain-containing protein [Candidatus Angelobacter sp.]|jgi:hypothetical protein
MFAANSRYLNVTTVEYESPTGKKYVYLRRRFLPQPESFVLLQQHVVTGGERLDNVAAQFLGDPELFWRLCDANGAMQPEELTRTVGRRLRITLPEGIPGTPNA